MQAKELEEANRQLAICNACRYCEGFCASFQAMTRYRSFDDENIIHMANLCHNCQACYHSCQFTCPHEFDLNIPKALANVRAESWESHVPGSVAAEKIQSNGWIIALITVVAAVMFGLVGNIPWISDENFYSLISHNSLVAVFTPLFLGPLLILFIGLYRYWNTVGGDWIKGRDLSAAFHAAGTMKNLDGGMGQGCNYENDDRYSQTRKWAHHATMYGFLLCFASTSVATIMHYGFGLEAPYPFLSLPKIFGVSGGILLTLGTSKLLYLKAKSDPKLGVSDRRSGEYGFILILWLVSTSGLLLYWLGGTAAAGAMLNIHLASIAAFFVTLPYTKMAHGFFRLAALIREAQMAKA